MNEAEPAKICTKCSKLKILKDFYRCVGFKDGRAYICKECSKDRRRRNYLNNREHELLMMREYGREHLDQLSSYRKAYRASHREELVAAGYVYRASRRTITSEREKQKRKTNPEVHIFNGAKKRAKDKGLPFSIEKKDIRIPAVCPILGIPLVVSEGVFTDNSPTLDRLTPELGYVSENVSVISNRANRMKDRGTAQEHRLLADWIEGKSKIPVLLQLANRRHARILVTCAKKRAAENNLPFSLKIEDILIPDICPALGIPIVRNKKHMQSTSPTLDKIVPELGYVPGNVAIISLKANRMKSNGTASEHRKIADWMDQKLAESIAA